MRWGLCFREIEIQQPRSPQVLGSHLVAESEPPPRGTELGVLGELGCTAGREGRLCQLGKDRERDRGNAWWEGGGSHGLWGGRWGRRALRKSCFALSWACPHPSPLKKTLKLRVTAQGLWRGPVPLWLFTAGVALRAGGVSVR